MLYVKVALSMRGSSVVDVVVVVVVVVAQRTGDVLHSFNVPRVSPMWCYTLYSGCFLIGVVIEKGGREHTEQYCTSVERIIQ